mmetsp:Transcript_142190/g.318149  ORF Transcript_142190/g.318149 Transcript_142190/m.318149 type:complete len:122 (+) Transcript_142190:709-1074(+)
MPARSSISFQERADICTGSVLVLLGAAEAELRWGDSSRTPALQRDYTPLVCTSEQGCQARLFSQGWQCCGAAECCLVVAEQHSRCCAGFEMSVLSSISSQGHADIRAQCSVFGCRQLLVLT